MPRSLPLLPALAAIVGLTFASPLGARADDLKSMEGTWRVESVEAGGKRVESEDLQNLELTISGEHYSVKTKDGMDAGTLKLDETQSPRTMDATKTEGLDAGKVVKGIYTIQGDTLKVCCVPEGGERPTEMTTKEGEGAVLIVYRRETVK
jgi:uncharacterized protein (TIGR03067 family)